MPERWPVATGAVAGAVLAGLAALIVLLVIDNDLPSTAEIRAAASALPDRDGVCAELRKQLGPLPEIARADAEQRVRSAVPGEPIDLRFADLRRAKLDGVNLGSADLRFARLTRASLEGTSFADADLSCADLTLAHGRASFRAARLIAADLTEADLQKSAFTIARLSHANLTNAGLKESDLGGAHLDASRIVGTDLEKANLTGTYLQYADYRPANAPRMIKISDLSRVFPRAAEFGGLSALRKGLIDLGENTQARLVTYLIESWRDDYAIDGARDRNCVVAALIKAVTWLRRIAFDWTVSYGMHPRHALMMLLISALAFALIYLALLATPFNTRDRGLFLVSPKGILKVWPSGRIEETAGSGIERVGRGAAVAALWFSVLSATRYGYGSFTLASWLGALYPGQEEYRGLGPFRVLSGLQALLSLYLLVVFVITLFGDPFSLWP